MSCGGTGQLISQKTKAVRTRTLKAGTECIPNGFVTMRALRYYEVGDGTHKVMTYCYTALHHTDMTRVKQ